jgi:hypothetical protein
MRAEIERADAEHAQPSPRETPARPGKGDSSAIRQPTHEEVQEAGDARASSDAQDATTGKGG